LTLLFLPPNWPRRVFNWPASPVAATEATAPTAPQLNHTALVLLAAYLAIQCLLPLRHWLYPGNPSWTEQGHRFAWHIRQLDAGKRIIFFSGYEAEVEPLSIAQGFITKPVEADALIRKVRHVLDTPVP
jgi:hypothetical protein